MALPKLPEKPTVENGPRQRIAKLKAKMMSESKRSPLTAGRRRTSARNASLVRHIVSR